MTIPKLDDGDNEREAHLSNLDVSADLARLTMQEEVERKESMPQHVPKHSEDELVTGYPTALPVTISTHMKHVEVMNRVATNFFITIASGRKLKRMDTSRDIVVALTREGERPEDDRGYLVIDTCVFKELTALPEMKIQDGSHRHAAAQRMKNIFYGLWLLSVLGNVDMGVCPAAEDFDVDMDVCVAATTFAAQLAQRLGLDTSGFQGVTPNIANEMTELTALVDEEVSAPRFESSLAARLAEIARQMSIKCAERASAAR